MSTPADEAEAVARMLGEVEPANATSEHIALGERALEALSGHEGSPVWQELCLQLGSFYLELPSGDKSANVDRAIALYGAVLADEPSFDAFVVAVNGLGNAALFHPDPDHEFYELALQLLKPLIDLLEDDEDVSRFACFHNVRLLRVPRREPAGNSWRGRTNPLSNAFCGLRPSLRQDVAGRVQRPSLSC